MKKKIIGWGSVDYSAALGFAANIGIVLAVGWLLLGPNSSVAEALRHARSNRATARAIGANWQALIATSARLGARQVPVALVVFLDYECRYCRGDASVIQKLLEIRPDVGIAVRHLPLPIHRNASAAALAAICASQQGAFSPTHYRLVRSSDWLTSGDVVSAVTASSRIDIRRLERCIGSVDAMDRLDHDLELAASIGIHGTPTYVSRKGMHGGAAVLEDLLSLLPAPGEVHNE